VSAKLDEMWAALEAHKPAPEYAEAWRVMCRERTEYAVSAAYFAAPKGSAARLAAAAAFEAARLAKAAVDKAPWAAEAAVVDKYTQQAIDAIKEVKP